MWCLYTFVLLILVFVIPLGRICGCEVKNGTNHCFVEEEREGKRSDIVKTSISIHCLHLSGVTLQEASVRYRVSYLEGVYGFNFNFVGNIWQYLKYSVYLQSLLENIHLVIKKIFI
jgi:hypothetical protein